MNRTRRRLLLAGFCLAVVLTAILLLRRGGPGEPSDAAPVSPAPSARQLSGDPVPEAALAAPKNALPEPSNNDDEIAATRRMYTAHAPLREPAVADPDSEENRRILETMVTKALASSTASPARAQLAPSAAP